jgi:hypothetical protein
VGMWWCGQGMPWSGLDGVACQCMLETMHGVMVLRSFGCDTEFPQTHKYVWQVFQVYLPICSCLLRAHSGQDSAVMITRESEGYTGGAGGQGRGDGKNNRNVAPEFGDRGPLRRHRARVAVRLGAAKQMRGLEAGFLRWSQDSRRPNFCTSKRMRTASSLKGCGMQGWSGMAVGVVWIRSATTLTKWAQGGGMQSGFHGAAWGGNACSMQCDRWATDWETVRGRDGVDGFDWFSLMSGCTCGPGGQQRP